MREIKFRAWHKTLNIMCGVSEITLYTRGIMMLLARNAEQMKLFQKMNEPINRCDELCVWVKEVNLMQYTGMKDKNGVEIYEGDIIRVTDVGEISELNSDTGLGAVEWLDKWGFWNVTSIENDLGYLLYSYDVEVMGNIYNNPELLKTK